jgi:hypothetical protein
VRADSYRSRDVFGSPPAFPDGLYVGPLPSYFAGNVQVCNATAPPTLSVNTISSCSGSNTVNVVAPGGLQTNGKYVADSVWPLGSWTDLYASFSGNDIVGWPPSQPNEYYLRFYYNDSYTINELSGKRYISMDLRVVSYTGPPPSIPEVDAIEIYLTANLVLPPGANVWFFPIRKFEVPRGVSGLRLGGVSVGYGRPFGNNIINPDMFVIRFKFSSRVAVSELYDPDNDFDNPWLVTFLVEPGLLIDDTPKVANGAAANRPKSASLPRDVVRSVQI